MGFFEWTVLRGALMMFERRRKPPKNRIAIKNPVLGCTILLNRRKRYACRALAKYSPLKLKLSGAEVFP